MYEALRKTDGIREMISKKPLLKSDILSIDHLSGNGIGRNVFEMSKFGAFVDIT